MSIANAQYESAIYGQDLTITVVMAENGSVSGWTTSAPLRAYNGGPALASGNVTVQTPGDGSNPGVFLITFSAADLTQTPGPYVWEFTRTNVGFVYPIIDPSTFYVRPSTASDSPTLTNFSELQAYLGIGAIPDSMVPFYIMLLSAAEAAVVRITGRKFVYGQYTEYLTANGTQTVTLSETPVYDTPPPVVYFDGAGYFGQGANAFGPDTAVTAGTANGFYLADVFGGVSMTGAINRIGGVWTSSRSYGNSQAGGWYYGASLPPQLTPLPASSPGSIKVTYYGGYKQIPADLKQAIFGIVADRAMAASSGAAFTSESFETYSRGLGSFTEEAMKIGSANRTITAYRKNYPLITGL